MSFLLERVGHPDVNMRELGYRTVGTLLRVTFFVTDFCFRVAKICNRQAGAAPEYAEKGVDPHLQTHVSGILGSLLQKCRKK